MSIINDALKKIQQGQAAKPAETSPADSTAAPQASGYIYANTPQPVVQPKEQPVLEIKPPMPNKIKSVLALLCSLAITAASVWYIYQQFKNDIPHVQRLARASFFKLVHKAEIPEFKTKSPQDLKPLGTLTLNEPMKSSKDAPVTLNIHGIMSNAKGNLVLINDQVYQEGDEIDGARIVKINLDSVTVIINGVEKTIPVQN